MRAGKAWAALLATAGLIAAGGATWLAELPAAAARSSGARAPDPRPTGICSRNITGQVVNCPAPISPGLLPAAAASVATVARTPANLAALVDTRTWTSAGGNTYPGADAPFGMIQWSPDTAPHRADGGGYTYGDTRLSGYSLTHLSGPGCLSAGDVPILPMTGPLQSGNPSKVTTTFTNKGEVAQAGYYSARSNRRTHDITAQFAALPHAAMGKFTFPKTRAAHFLIKLQDSQLPVSASAATIVGNNEVKGSVSSGGFCNEAQGNGFGRQDYRVYFDLVFSRHFTKSQVITNSNGTDAVFLTFDTHSNRIIEAKVAISYVSTANAHANWRHDLTRSSWNFLGVKRHAQTMWNRLLRRISVSGGSYARTQQFYSNLYKSFLQPNIVSDVNGHYLGSDYLQHSVRRGQRSQYGMFSGWDTYHAQSQLVAMLDPAAASDMAQSLVNEYKQNGILPQWGYLNTDNYTQVGDPSDAIIADYYAFGARHFDTHAALTAMLNQANNTNTVRPGAAIEASDGFLPQVPGYSDSTTTPYGCCRLHDEVSALLEYDTADLALSFFVKALGDHSDAAKLENRANNWANEFDTANNLLAPRNPGGTLPTFQPGVTRTTGRTVYIEGDAYEYLWDVPNNYAGLFTLLGGKAKVRPMLVRYLSKPNGKGMYALLSNEFGLGEQNALDYAGDPAGTQLAVNTMRDRLYRPGPDGFHNNDDLGANSAVFVWEMLGMYPENPGSGTLVFASPGFPHAVIHLPNGKHITISAAGASPTKFYVKALKINGRPHSTLWVTYAKLARGATLTWTLGKRATRWGSAPADAPPSYGTAPPPPTP
jgi:predicted alpha-1,2-mannosidase